MIIRCATPTRRGFGMDHLLPVVIDRDEDVAEAPAPR